MGNRTRVDLGNTTHTTYTYPETADPRYFLDAIGHYDSSNALLTSAAITYTSRDDSGNPTEIEDWDPARYYDYDNNNRLISGGGDSFGYDWVGNRLNPPANPSPMVYDATDKLVRWPLEHKWGGTGTDIWSIDTSVSCLRDDWRHRA